MLRAEPLGWRSLVGSFLFATVYFAMGAACCAMACFRLFPIHTIEVTYPGVNAVFVITNSYDLYKGESLFSARNDIASEGQRNKTAV
jgi:hypothetical protein